MRDNQGTERFREGNRQFNCSSCGALLHRRFRYTKLIVCEQCRSILYLRRGAVDVLGNQAALADHPSLFRRYHRFAYRNLLLEPVGTLRYGYGRGFWEEWWCLESDGEGHWISVDEGDFVMEQKQSIEADLPPADALEPGMKIDLMNASWTVTELGTAQLQGMEGELPDIVKPDRNFRYAHMERPGSKLVTLEYNDPAGRPEIYLGEWMDPFDIKAL